MKNVFDHSTPGYPRMSVSLRHHLALGCLILLMALQPCSGKSPDAATPSARVEFKQNGKQQMVLGNILVEAEDGGILIETRDQMIWPLQPDEIVSRQVLEKRPKPLDEKELAAAVLADLPPGFRVHKTNHYLVCYNTSRAYAEWSGALFERLHRAFTNYWSKRGLDLEDTPPLVALVFRDKKSYQAYGRAELGDAINSILGYYSYKSNRIAMFDMLEGRRSGSAMQINALMRRERTVATVVHEATHQLAFNCGLQQRYADIPLWLSEGLAIYFETPDLKSSRGWTTIGDVNRLRLGQFRKFASRRSPESLLSLISTDDRFQTVGLASDAYAESWAFCYFLIRTQPREFAKYLKLLQTKEPLVEDTPEARVEDFRKSFGQLPQEMNRDFLRHIRKIR